MAHYVTIPINENGIIFDPDMNAVIQEAIANAPFGFQDVYLYSHGWATDAYQALDQYNRFSIDLAKLILLAGPAAYPIPPRDSLGVGIHWPSQITEDPGSVLNALELLTFYTMEHRADAVGKNAVYAILRLLLKARAAGPPLRIFLLGHSFGCKVICAALQDMQVDIENKTIPVAPGTSFRAVLLEPATDNDNLEPGDIYGDVCAIKSMRVLISTSQLDSALTEWYVKAGKLANLFHEPPKALGAAGPTVDTVTAFLGADNVDVTPGFTAADMTRLTKPMIVANLTPIHQVRVAGGFDKGFGGSHSDINLPEIYEMICGFLFS